MQERGLQSCHQGSSEAVILAAGCCSSYCTPNSLTDALALLQAKEHYNRGMGARPSTCRSTVIHALVRDLPSFLSVTHEAGWETRSDLEPTLTKATGISPSLWSRTGEHVL